MSAAPPSHPEPVPSAPGWRWAPLLLVAVAWIAHGSVRGHGWVLDDVHLVRDNPLVARGPEAVGEILAGGASGAVKGVAHGSHGPVAIASFALEAPLWRRADGSLKPAGFHLTNLLLHGLCVLLLFRAVLLLAPGRPLLALAAGLVFAAHPLHAGTVSALMGRAAILAALFALLATLAWRRVGDGRSTWLPVALGLYLLALFSHPVAIGLPLALAVLDRARGSGSLARAGVLAFAVPLAVFLLAGGATPWGAGDLPAQGIWDRWQVGAEGIARMLLALVLPTGLLGDHSDEAVPGVGYVVGTLGHVAQALLLLSVAAIALRARRARLGTGAAIWLGTLALAVPACLVLPAGAALEARWAYVVALPLFAYAGLLAEGLLRAGGASPSFARARLALVGALALVCLIGLTHREARAWQDDDAFHAALLERNPSHVRAMVRHAESRRLAAERYRESSAGLRAGDPERDLLLAHARDALVDADRWSVRAVRHELGRKDPAAWRVRGLVLLAGNKSANALRALERARDLDPALKQPVETMRATYGPERLADAAAMYAAIARARESLGEREPAADAYAIATVLAGDDLALMYRAGMALCRVNRYQEGLALLVEARRRTTDLGFRREIDDALRSARDSAREIARRLIAQGHAAKADGKMRKAVTFYEQAVEVNPASVDAWSHAGWLRGHWFGNYDQAERYLAKAETLLREGKVPASDPRWARIAGYRRMLAEQLAQEDEPDGGG